LRRFSITARYRRLAAKVALNLDGGTSTGMKLTLGEHKDEVKVGIELPNFICVTYPK